MSTTKRGRYHLVAWGPLKGLLRKTAKVLREHGISTRTQVRSALDDGKLWPSTFRTFGPKSYAEVRAWIGRKT